MGSRRSQVRQVLLGFFQPERLLLLLQRAGLCVRFYQKQYFTAIKRLEKLSGYMIANVPFSFMSAYWHCTIQGLICSHNVQVEVLKTQKYRYWRQTSYLSERRRLDLSPIGGTGDCGELGSACCLKGTSEIQLLPVVAMQGCEPCSRACASNTYSGSSVCLQTVAHLKFLEFFMLNNQHT